jgi:hypothetical protein
MTYDARIVDVDVDVDVDVEGTGRPAWFCA